MGGESAVQSACDVTSVSGGDVAVPPIGELLIPNGTGAGDYWTAKTTSGISYGTSTALYACPPCAATGSCAL